MIVVKVELHSAITGRVSELARMVIANDGTQDNPRKGNYVFATLRGRSREALEKALAHWVSRTKSNVATHSGEVKDYPRLALHVWNLVARCLNKAGYE